MNWCTRSRTSSSGGWNDQALVSIRMSERTRSGRSSTMVMTTRPPMECPRRSTGPPPTASRNAARSSASCCDRVPLEAPDLGRVPVATVVVGDHPSMPGQLVHLEGPVVRRAGVAVTEHEGRFAAPPFGPGEVDAVHVEGLRLRGGRHPTCLADAPLLPPGPGHVSPRVAGEGLHGGGGSRRGLGRRGGDGCTGRGRHVGTGAGLVPRGQGRGGGRSRERLGQVVHDDGRPPGHRVDVATRGGDDERTAGVLGRRVVVEGEVAQPVVDVGRAEVAATEQDVGVRSDDDVGAGLRRGPGPAAPAAGSGRRRARCPSAGRRSRCQPSCGPPRRPPRGR